MQCWPGFKSIQPTHSLKWNCCLFRLIETIHSGIIKYFCCFCVCCALSDIKQLLLLSCFFFFPPQLVSPLVFVLLFLPLSTGYILVLKNTLWQRKKGKLSNIQWGGVSWGRRRSESSPSGRGQLPFGPVFWGVRSPARRCATSAKAWRSWAGGHSSAVAPPSGRGCSQSLPGWPRHTAGWLDPVQRHQWLAHSAQEQKTSKTKLLLGRKYHSLFVFFPSRYFCLPSYPMFLQETLIEERRMFKE